MIKLSDISTNEENPRFIKDERFEKLCKSIEEFPKMMELRPIVVDKEGVALGGNMRYRALLHLGYKEVPHTWIRKADTLTEEEKQRFIIADNVGFGAWDWDVLANAWETEQLEEWGLELPGFAADGEEFGEGFELPDGDKSPFQQMTFTLADDQAEQIKGAMDQIKKTDAYKYAETYGNENTNGNALAVIIQQWAEQKISA